MVNGENGTKSTNTHTAISATKDNAKQVFRIR